MPSKDLTTSLKNEIALNIQAITTDTTTTGNIIDVSDAGRANLTFISGAYTDGSYVILLEESDSSSFATSNVVVDADMLGEDPDSSDAPELQTTIAAAHKIKKLGYVGIKSHIRAKVVSTATTSGATLGCIVEKEPRIKPASITA